MGRDMGKRCWRSFMLRMKKCAALLLTAILGLLISIPAAGVKADVAGVQINDTNFKDANLRSYLTQFADGNRDGYLSSSEIDDLTYMCFRGKKLTSLSGIEYLTNLQTLEIINCNLPSLDLGRNTALKRVQCTDSHLTSLTLGKLPALTELRCSNNQLTSLNVTGCPNLTVLNCWSNQIESLNLSKCTALTTLGCGGNQLTTLNVRACTALTTLSCSENLLTTLDLQKNTALTNLYCESNQLTTLDLRKNTALTKLQCRWNQLETLDLRKNTALTDVACSCNQLTTLNFDENSKITNLECHQNMLTGINLSKMKSLKILYCYTNSLTTLDVSSCEALERLYCEWNCLTELDVTKNTVLKKLDCSYNGLTSIDLRKNTALEDLNCSWNRLTSLDLSKNTNLAKASCWYNKLSVIDIHLCPILVNVVRNNERKTGSQLGEEHYYYSNESGEFIDFDKNVKLITYIPSVGKVTGLTAESAGKNMVKLTWDAVEGAEGYLVYAQKDGKYGYVGMTTKGTTFTDTKALDTDYNYYWVFAYAKDDGGFMHAGGCEKYVYAKGVTLAVTNLKASSVTGGVKLTWTGSSGAEGYLVYGIRPGGSYGYIGMTTKGTTYTDTKASNTDYTFYWVFPYHKDAGGNMIVGGTAKYTYGRSK